MTERLTCRESAEVRVVYIRILATPTELRTRKLSATTGQHPEFCPNGFSGGGGSSRNFAVGGGGSRTFSGNHILWGGRFFSVNCSNRP